MSHRVFDTYSNALESQQLNDFLQNKVAKNRLLIFAVQDEAAYALSNETVDLMREIGCKLCLDLGKFSKCFVTEPCCKIGIFRILSKDSMNFNFLSRISETRILKVLQ